MAKTTIVLRPQPHAVTQAGVEKVVIDEADSYEYDKLGNLDISKGDDVIATFSAGTWLYVHYDEAEEVDQKDS